MKPEGGASNPRSSLREKLFHFGSLTHAKSAVAKAEHVSEDFNKVRTVDLLISINKTEEETSRHEARLYFAASRNQESGFTVRIEQDMAKMQFIRWVLRIE